MTSLPSRDQVRTVLERCADRTSGCKVRIMGNLDERRRRCGVVTGGKHLPTSLTVLILVVVATVSMPTDAAIICEPINIPMCESMTYNLTRMPNLLHHSTQQNARLLIEQFEPLVNYSCSAHLSFFLCAMFVPICPKGFDQTVIPPCRGVCAGVRRQCEPVVVHYNLTWPEYLECDGLPEYERGVCLTPDSIVTDSRETGFPDIPVVTERPAKKPTPRKKKCNCKMNKGLKFREIFRKRRYEFAIRGKFKKIQRVSGGPVVMTIYVRHVLMTSPHSDIPVKQEVTLWNQKGCRCEWFKKGGDYIVLGHIDHKNHRLLFDDRSYIEEGSKKLRNRVKKVAQDIHSKREKRRGRRNQKNRKNKHRTTKKNKKKKKKRKDGVTPQPDGQSVTSKTETVAKSKKAGKPNTGRRHKGKSGRKRGKHKTDGHVQNRDREKDLKGSNVLPIGGASQARSLLPYGGAT